MTGNPKGALIARCRADGLGEPEFAGEASGPGHEPHFTASVWAGGTLLGQGEGRSRREAERAASEAALQVLDGQVLDGEEPDGAAAVDVAPTRQRWPIYAELLSQALIVAHERREDGTLDDVRRDAAALYRGLLQELGVPPREEVEV